MVLSTKFDMFERVVISETGKEGIVVEIIMQGSDLVYKVQLWDDCEQKFFSLYEFEIEKGEK